MKYCVLAADYLDVFLKDEFSGKNALDDLDLDNETKIKLKNWNKDYKKIIPMENEERMINLNLINKLDKEGIDLSKIIEKQNQIKIKYYSEGLLRFLQH